MNPLETELYNALVALASTARTFRNVPKDEQDWGPLDDEALEAAFVAIEKAELTTNAAQSHQRGVDGMEPLLLAMDGALRYAKAYRKRWGRPLREDGVLGEYWLDWVKGIRGLLNGDGAVAWENGWTTDSKDNGVVEGIFWDALNAAGFEEKDL